jgi:hypothetical protein
MDGHKSGTGMETVEGMRSAKTRLGGAGINGDRSGWAATATDVFFLNETW